MGRMYTLTFEGASVTNANGDHDYFNVDPATDKPVVIHAVFVSFYSETGDAAEEIIRWGIVRGNTTLPGSTPDNTNVRALNPGDAAFSGTGEAFNTAIATAGTEHRLHADAFNLRVGLVWVPTPEMRPCASGADLISVRQFSTLADDANANGTLYIEELG